MKNSHLTLLLFATSFATSVAPVIAQSGDATPENRFGLGLAAYSSGPEYKDHNQGALTLHPVYRGKRINVDHDELSFNFTPDNAFKIEALLKRQHFGFDAENSDTFKDMEDRHEVFGVGSRLGLGGDWGAISLGLFHNPIDDDDVKDAESGSSVSVNYGYPVRYGAFEITPNLGLQWFSDEVVDFLYGVSAAEVTATRASYIGESAGTPFVGVDAEGMLNKNLRLISGLRFEALPDEIADSPLVDDDNTVKAHVGVAWMF